MGLALGEFSCRACGSWALTQLIASFFVWVKAHDPLVFSRFLGAGLVALLRFSLRPNRAARVSPLESLLTIDASAKMLTPLTRRLYWISTKTCVRCIFCSRPQWLMPSGVRYFLTAVLDPICVTCHNRTERPRLKCSTNWPGAGGAACRGMEKVVGSCAPA